MNRYCTLFDSYYLTRGLALHESLVRVGEPFLLYIYCFDDLVRELLTKLRLENVVLVSLAEFETPELLAVKAGRTKGEYCWTCASHTIRHVIQVFGASEVTYIDADLFFFDRPSLLLEEFHQAQGSVLITEHRYAPEYDQSATSGKYCVQFMTFKSNPRAMEVLNWWCSRCVEWCFNRIEDGKFGDQKYLDDWTTRFEGVHVLEHPGGGLAPWNIKRYRLDAGPRLEVSSGTQPVVFYHFHALKWFSDGEIDLAERYKVPVEAKKYVYQPYLECLRSALHRVRSIQGDFNLGKVPRKKSWRDLFRQWKRRLNGNYNIVSE